MLRSLFLAILCCLATTTFAGKITGTIKDSKDSSGLPGVVINIRTTDKNAVTDIDGHFEINDLPNGTYELVATYVSYKKQVQRIVVNGDNPVVVDFALVSERAQISGVSVKATRATQTEVAVLNEIRKSSVIVSGISAAQIGKTMDRNAADVVKRIPGVTIQDDRFINVRGLADRYNTVWLNDAGAPSAEVDKKSFSFDLIPSGLIDRILVFKTPSPELPGDFAGGMVKIYTTSLPAKNTYTFGLQTSYRSGSTGTNFNYNERSKTDWLGYDDGQRSLPEGFPNYKPDDPNAGAEVASLSKLFKNDWIVKTKKQPLDLRVNGSASNIFRIGKVKIGNTFGFSYSSTNTNFDRQIYAWVDTSKQLHFNDQESIAKNNIGLLDNLVVAIGNTKIEWKNLYNQVGTSTVIYRTTDTNDVVSGGGKQEKERSYVMGYESKATYTSQLSGTHKNDADTRHYNWTLGYTDLFRNQPSLRRIRYVETAPGSDIYQSLVPGGVPDIVNGGGRFYAELYEHVYSFSHQFSQKFRITEKFVPEVNVGNYVEYRSRFFNARELGFTLRGSAISDSLLRLPINDIFAEQNVGSITQFRIGDGTSDYAHYNATNRLIASFISLNVAITPRLKAVGGVRYEDNLYTLSASLNQRPVAPEITTNFLLPSINVSYNFSSKSLLRFAYGKTVNRPEFRETAPFYFYDFQRRAGTYGALSFGDTLEVAEIHNIDARYEFYPSAGEVFQAGVFYKKFKNPIQQAMGYYGGDLSFSYVNGSTATSYGLELDARKNLMFLDDKIGTGFLKNFTIVGNLTLAKSDLTIDSSITTTDLNKKATLEGQSNYVINFGAFYQNDTLGLQGSLLYNVYGPRLYAIGTTTDDPNIGELAFHSLDFTLSKTFFKHYNVNFGVQNLLDQTFRFRNDTNRDNKFDDKNDTPFTSAKPGRYFSFGLRVRF